MRLIRTLSRLRRRRRYAIVNHPGPAHHPWGAPLPKARQR